MAELKRPPTKSRGFYVRMRLLHGYSKHHQRQAQDKSFFRRHYKWVLWLSLSCYFFSPYLLSQSPKQSLNPLHATGFAGSGSTHSSRALFESSLSLSNSSSRRSQEPKIDQELRGLKIYVYDLPPKYNSEWLSNERCSTHLFASEVAIHRALLTSDVRTLDPREADFFFVPVYVSCNFSTTNGFPAIGHARSLLLSAVQLISSEHPFWNRSSGSDHVFVASHDYGACFHAMEDRAIADGVPEFLKKSIILQTFGVSYDHPCQDVEHVVIPPYIPPESVRRTLEASPAGGGRDIWAFFRGKMEVHPKNISGRFYSKAVRSVIWHKYSGDRRFYLRRHRFAGYQSEIVRSVFCLCPLGWAPWSPRLVESVALGCVPVVVADGIRLPFPDAVPWPEISLAVAERDAARLGPILGRVAATNLSAIQRKLWSPEVRRALLYNDRVERGDATWHVLRSLAHRLDRSRRRRRSRVYGQ
ncbi:probable glucuronoxylan glucuronosyltransferase IRX7 [Syzygium oleosum]|uniref:probable glucuronoxylan glucuronosyltransferase IRX7 n=1 Tax=Syzygium oleosum TaxID=219896 RepID=UPI0011D236E3|nr:probable glucuronoxylan glucuronosyltransferase IRX7 [Syzygium oleosum]